MQGYIYIGALLALSFVFQYQLKLFANEIGPILSRQDAILAERLGEVLRASLAWRPMLILVLAGALFLLWLMALTKLELSVALPLATMPLVINSVGIGLLLGEELSLRRTTGILVAAVGITMVLTS